MIKKINWNGYEFITFEYEVNGKLQWVFLGRQVVESLGYTKKYTVVIKGDNINNPKVNINNYIEVSKKQLEKLVTDLGTSFKIAQRGELLLTELGVYELIMKSNMDEAEEFQQWVYQTLQDLRQNAGLEAYEVFRMMDKDIQKKCSSFIAENGNIGEKEDNIIMNKNVNEITSLKYGIIDKPVTKGEMEKYYPEMLADRQGVLSDYCVLFGYTGSHKDTKRMMKEKLN